MDNEKRIAGDYEITAALFIGDGEVVIGENTTEKGCRFMMAVCHQNDLFAQYQVMQESDNYAEIVQSFGERVALQARQIQEEVKALNIPTEVITKEDCIPDSFDRSIEGKIIAINPEVLRSEYQRADRQLYLVTGGFGASANSRGSAVFCKNLHTGEHTRFERRDVLGEVKPERLPDWAKKKSEDLPKQDKPKKYKSRER